MPIGPDEWERGDTAVDELPALSYKLVTHKECRCCAHEDIVELDELFLRDLISGQEVADTIGVSPAYYSIHINRDVLRPAKEEIAKSPVVQGAVQDTLSIVQRMRTSLNLYMNRLELLIVEPLDQRTEFRIKALSSEVRAWAQLLLTLEGQLNDSPLIVIQNMEVNFQKIIETVMAEASPTLQRKLIPLIGDRVDLKKYM